MAHGSHDDYFWEHGGRYAHPAQECDEYEYNAPVGDEGDILRFRQRWDLRGNMVDFAIIQMASLDGRMRRVAAADICHDELHIHVFNQQGEKIARESIQPVSTDQDVGKSYDAGLDRIEKSGKTTRGGGAMDDRERLRLQMTRDVAKLLRHRSLREALPSLSPDGSTPFMVGLPDDTLRAIRGKVATLGGEAHLIMPAFTTSGPVRLRILRISSSGQKPISELDDSRECAVGENSTLAMLLEHMEVGEELTYYTYDSGTVIRFINDSLQPVPA